ncbi:MAG: hypothetical protein FWH07_00220 [Oscillospiraceae bacterium]|nr:hypothetical protein [Oscillospiraceae bacterium]
MKTVLIDKSLVGTSFTKGLADDKKAVFLYVCALIEAGASYIELDFDSVVRLPKPSGAENYIFRLNRPEEFVVANALNFSYAVLPLRLSYVMSKLELPVILEIDTGDSDVFDILQIVASNIDLSQYGMIRLTGDFEPDSIPEIISTYKRRTIIPIDICPKNSMLTALNSAIAAVSANSDAVTVRFGDYKDYASLEELLIMLSSMHKLIVSPDYLEGICKAALISSIFSEGVGRSNLSLMMQKYMHGPLRIPNIDRVAEPETAELSRLLGSRIRMNDVSDRGNLMSRVLGNLGLEQEVSGKLADILQNCNIELFKVIKEDDE